MQSPREPAPSKPAEPKSRPEPKDDEPPYDENEGLDEYDKTLADSFPASDPPAPP